MPAETTISVSDETKAQLANYRDSNHHSWDAVIQSMMHVLPNVEEWRDGCANCGKEPPASWTMAETGGVVSWFEVDRDNRTFHVSTPFCSPECLVEHREEVEAYFPEHPDEVIVGGREMVRTTVESATMYVDEETKEISFPIPGAFDGTNSHGDDYEYVGEPVYVKHQDRWIDQGVIGQIIHEDHLTTFLLESDYDVTKRYHPDKGASRD